MGSYLGIDPPRTREFSRCVLDAAGELRDLSLAADRALDRAQLDSGVPRYLDALAADLDALGRVLGGRAASAAGFTIALTRAVVDLQRTVAAAVPLVSCRLGPHTAVGSASPCDPVTEVELYTISAGVEVPLGALTLRTTREHSFIVEKLASGQQRVTIVDAGSLGAGLGAGQTATAEVNGHQAGVDHAASVLAALKARAGQTFVIGPSELDELIVDDLLRQLETGGSGVAALVDTGGMLKGLARKVLTIADRLPSGPLHPLITKAREKLAWQRPDPVARFIEAGAGAAAGASVRSRLAGLGVNIEGEGVVGIGDRAGEQTIYLRLSAIAQASAAFATFGRQLAANEQIQIGVVRSGDGTPARVEVTRLSVRESVVVRETATYELRDLAHVADGIERALVDPERVAAKLDELRRLRPVNVESTTFVFAERKNAKIAVPGGSITVTVDRLVA